MLVALVTVAHAADVEQDLTWTVTLDGKPVGERTATIKWFTDDSGDVRRMIESYTEADASLIGVQYTVKERLTAMCTKTAGSFQTVIDVSGDAKQIQARRGPLSWSITVNDNGKEYTHEWANQTLDLSTADLLDPDSRVPLGSFPNARVLVAESGDILEGPVKSLGPGLIDVGGQSIPVTGWSWTVDGQESRFWYTTDGYLVRYESPSVIGHQLMGTLASPPPMGTDEAPVQSTGGGASEIPL